MKSFIAFLTLILSLTIAAPAFGDDQQKAQKELNKVTAMATDFTGRRAVNIAMSHEFNVPRAKLVEARGLTGLNYGSLFVAEQLEKNGMSVQDIAAQLQQGKTIAAIASEHHVDWKDTAAAAKKFNATVDTALYNYFLRTKDSTALDAADNYDVHYDGVKADAEVSKDEIQAAQDRFLRWRDQAAKAVGEGRDKTLSTGDERVAYNDHVSNGGPALSGTPGRGSGGTSAGPGTTAPVGMGGPH
jgi:hypothetical protein